MHAGRSDGALDKTSFLRPPSATPPPRVAPPSDPGFFFPCPVRPAKLSGLSRNPLTAGACATKLSARNGGHRKHEVGTSGDHRDLGSGNNRSNGLWLFVACEARRPGERVVPPRSR